MSGERPDVPDDDLDIQDSDQGTAGDMGVSSEREGHAGPGQHGTTGVRDTSAVVPDGDTPPEQAAGGPEVHPDPPIPPVSGYSSKDPRSEE